MNLRRTLAFTKRTLLQFRHDRRTLGFVIAMPLIMITIFGYTFAGNVKGVKVEVLNMDKGVPPSFVLPNGLNVGEKVISHLDAEVLSISYSDDINASRQRVHDGKLWTVISFPSNFSQNLVLFMTGTPNASRPQVEVYVDGSSPNIAGAVIKTLNEATLAAIKEIATELKKPLSDVPIAVAPEYAYGGGDTKFIDYFAPGIITFAMMMVTTMISIILFVNERRNGTLQRILATPATEGEIVAGYAIAFAVIGLMQSLVIMTAAILLFNITIVGNILLALLVVLLIAFGHQGLGILLSAGAKNELQAIQFIPLIIFPSVLLAGLFWPVESIPALLQPFSYFVPLRYGIDAERSIMLRGWGIEQVWPQILILIAFAASTLGGSILLLKKRD